MVTLTVDFNRVDERGRLTALVPLQLKTEVHRGMSVKASDGEGTERQAIIEEIGDKGVYVFLVPSESIGPPNRGPLGIQTTETDLVPAVQPRR
jgi:hypothetical protein